MKNKFLIPIALTIIMSLIQVAWSASKVSEKVDRHEQLISSIEVTLQCIPAVKERLARIEEGQKYQTDILREVRAEVRKK